MTRLGWARVVLGGLGSGLAIGGMANGLPWWGALLIVLASVAVSAFVLKSDDGDFSKNA